MDAGEDSKKREVSTAHLGEEPPRTGVYSGRSKEKVTVCLKPEEDGTGLGGGGGQTWWGRAPVAPDTYPDNSLSKSKLFS